MCHPATVDSISTSAAQEDHVSMGTFAALKSLRVMENVERVLGIELMCACQALDLTVMTSTMKVEAVKNLVRTRVPFWKKDGIAYQGMDECWKFLRSGDVLHSVIRSTPHAIDSILAQPVRDADKVRGNLKPFVPKMDKRSPVSGASFASRESSREHGDGREKTRGCA